MGVDQQHFGNWDRPHMALGGNTPIDICERLATTPLADEFDVRSDLQREWIRVADYDVVKSLIDRSERTVVHRPNGGLGAIVDPDLAKDRLD